MKSKKRITIYCASSPMIDSSFFAATDKLAQLLVQNNLEIVYGAGSMGIMGAIADGIISRGGKVTGVIPQFMVDRNWCHKSLTNTIITHSMHERKETMANMGDAAIALPGGIGTLEELLEIITWKQLGLYTHPIIILNTNGYYDNLIAMLQHAIDNQFMRPIHAQLWYVATTPEEVITALETIPEWDSTLGKLALVQ